MLQPDLGDDVENHLLGRREGSQSAESAPPSLDMGTTGADHRRMERFDRGR